jgi:SAM-dependent methyltransferase
VLLVDALRWVPDRTQRRALLQRARAVLRPGGSLLIADGNRLGPDRLIRGGNRQAALATQRGYRRLLHEAGFSVERTYAALPSHLEPFFLVPIGTRAPLAYFLGDILGTQDFGAQLEQRGLRPLYRMVRMAVRAAPASWIAAMAAMFVPSLAIVART